MHLRLDVEGSHEELHSGFSQAARRAASLPPATLSPRTLLQPYGSTLCARPEGEGLSIIQPCRLLNHDGNLIPASFVPRNSIRTRSVRKLQAPRRGVGFRVPSATYPPIPSPPVPVLHLRLECEALPLERAGLGRQTISPRNPIRTPSRCSAKQPLLFSFNTRSWW